MPRYAITERAGPFVAAHRNTGVGTVLELTERQALSDLLSDAARAAGDDRRAAGQVEKVFYVIAHQIRENKD